MIFSVCSIITQASLFFGTILPVGTYTHSPLFNSMSQSSPILLSPTTFKNVGIESFAPWVSLAITAYPSTTDLSNSGTATLLTIFSAKIKSSASRTSSSIISILLPSSLYALNNFDFAISKLSTFNNSIILSSRHSSL